MSWLFLALAIITEVAATLSLRASEGLKRKIWAVPIAIGYIAAFVCLGFSLHFGMPVAVAYGVWAATGIALTAVLSRVIFKEPLSRTMAIGIALIAVGVITVELGSSAAH
ncbi:cation transporter [Leifsonia sp. Root4]|uniref:DMT family transporter n=1 Tax=Leifsonia sp. Root4 TaxID=1736525 RepID=UPI0007001017|nr:multidrug efflux SMR transporter [Leifsonia sp. Root4]KQW08136.1 cation transporter [Leifsonia sp. Root4]